MNNSTFAEKIVECLKEVWRDTADSKIPLHRPLFNGNEENYVSNCISSTFVSSVGTYVDEFEKGLQQYTNAKYAIATVNGTSALHICLLLAGVKPQDEVIIPSVSFIATANAVSYVGAIPHFVDSNIDSMGIDPHSLDLWMQKISILTPNGYINKATGRRLKAIVPVHIFGHPCQLNELKTIANKYKLALVEDAAEGLGSFYMNEHVGNSGLISALSFNGNKIITTGGGGCILTNNKEIADAAKHLTTTAKLRDSRNFVHDQIGYNYRMPNLNAAIGCAQLEQLDDFIDSKRLLYCKYKRAFSWMIENNYLQLMSEPFGCKSNYWLQTLILSNDNEQLRDDIILAAEASGFMARPLWRPLHQQPPYAHCPRSPLPIAESLAQRIINIPSSATES